MKVQQANLVLLFSLFISVALHAQTEHISLFKPVSALDLNLVPMNQSRLRSTSLLLVKTQFDAQKLPFFCKMEHQLEGTARFPVRIRLGDVRYVNKLESKH